MHLPFLAAKSAVLSTVSIYSQGHLDILSMILVRRLFLLAWPGTLQNSQEPLAVLRQRQE